MQSSRLLAAVSAVLLFLSSCNGGAEKPSATTEQKPAAQVKTPAFNADSAYSLVATQVAFGPRTPGSGAQKQCAAWMEQQLKHVCDTVYIQNTTVTGGDKQQLPCINLVGSINPAAKRRILLLTHWDSRPWGDEDKQDRDKPILAADDGGSGVAVLLEVAKQVKAMGLSPELGVDILFTDVEDYGRDVWGENSFCLGTQYWAAHPHVPGYKAEFGILLDMVGARGAQFPLERISRQFADAVQQNVWQAAAHAGYSSFFPFADAPGITDDHVPVNQIAGIKTIDIVNLTNNPRSPFAAHWHTHQDNMDIIDRSTLKAVGQTLLQVIYESAAGSI